MATITVPGRPRRVGSWCQAHDQGVRKRIPHAPSVGIHRPIGNRGHPPRRPRSLRQPDAAKYGARAEMPPACLQLGQRRLNTLSSGGDPCHALLSSARWSGLQSTILDLSRVPTPSIPRHISSGWIDAWSQTADLPAPITKSGAIASTLLNRADRHLGARCPALAHRGVALHEAAKTGPSQENAADCSAGPGPRFGRRPIGPLEMSRWPMLGNDRSGWKVGAVRRASSPRSGFVALTEDPATARSSVAGTLRDW